MLVFSGTGDVGEALKKPTPPGFFLLVAKGVAAAASYIHQAGYMHRDIKSPNVLIDSAHGVKLADLGLARSVPQATNTRCPESHAACSPLDPLLHPTCCAPGDVCVPQAGHTVSKWGASGGRQTAGTGSSRVSAHEVRG